MLTGTHPKNARDLATGHDAVISTPTRNKSKHGNQYDPPAEVLANMSTADLSKWRYVTIAVHCTATFLRYMPRSHTHITTFIISEPKKGRRERLMRSVLDERGKNLLMTPTR